MSRKTETGFDVGDDVTVTHALAAAVGVENLTGQVIGFEDSGRTWAVVRFPARPSGRPDFGYLFDPDSLTLDQTGTR